VALEDAGYAVEEVQPPSIDLAARTWLDILIPPVRAGWQVWSPLVRAGTRRFVSALFEVAGDPGPAASIACFMTRQSLLRAWGSSRNGTR
jgi:hypothetical protein